MRTTSIQRALVAVAALGLLFLAVPRPAVACSCVPPETIIDSLHESPEGAVFTGEPGAPEPMGTPVAVSGWFGGPAPAAVVALQVDEGDGASCGTTGPPPGREYLFLTYRTEDGRYGVNLCNPAVDLTTPDGQALLAKAVDVLGPAVPVDGAPPGAPGTDDPVASLAPLALGIAAFIAVVGGLFFWIGRREDG